MQFAYELSAKLLFKEVLSISFLDSCRVDFIRHVFTFLFFRKILSPSPFILFYLVTNLQYCFTRAVYEELGKYGDVENQVLCRQRVEELDPSIRYCNYKMGNVNIQGSDLLDLRNQEGPGLDLLQSKLQVSNCDIPK